MSKKRDSHAKGMGKKSARHPNKMIRQYRLLLDKEGEVLPCTPRGLSQTIAEQMRELGNDPIPFALQPSDAFVKAPAKQQPDNVTDIADARKRKQSARLEKKKAKANKPKQKAKAKPAPKAKVKCVNTHGWLHNKAMAIGEFQRWTKRPANGANVLQYQQQREEHKARSLNGAPRINKKVQNIDSSTEKISVVHNPGLSATPVVLDKSKLPDIDKPKPLDPKFWNPAAQHKVRLAPSGLPMEMFEAGGKYGPASNDEQSAVVYTTQQQARETAREYRAQRDASLVGYVSQVVNTVEPQFWSRVLYDYVEVRGDDDYIVQTGAINKTINTEDERVITRALLDTMAAYAYWQDEERSSLVIERNTLEWELGARINTGADDEQRKIPTPPEECDKLIAEVKLFNSLLKFEGPERTYARYVYGDPKLGDTVRQHFDHLANERQRLFCAREEIRRLQYLNPGYDRIKLAQEKMALYRIKHKVRNAAKVSYIKWWEERTSSIYYRRLALKNKAHDCVTFARWGNKIKPFCNRMKPVNYQQVINDVVGVRSYEYSSPRLIVLPKKHPHNHRKYMNSKIAAYYRSQSLGGKTATAVKSFLKSTRDILNTELNPRERKRIAKAKHDRAAEKSQAKAARKAESKRLAEQRAIKEAARRAYRNAH